MGESEGQGPHPTKEREVPTKAVLAARTRKAAVTAKIRALEPDTPEASPTSREEPHFGMQMRAWREGQGYSQKDVAEALGLTRQGVSRIETTGFSSLSTYHALVTFIEQNDQSEAGALFVKEIGSRIVEYETQGREQQWLRTLAGVDYPMAIRLISLAEGLDQNDFSTEAEINSRALLDHVKKGRFSFPVFDNIISAAGFDTNGKVAQLLRLKALKPFDVVPLSREQLLQCSAGALAKYIRIARGMSLKRTAEAIGISEGSLSEIERPSTDKTIAWKRHVGSFIKNLELPSEDPLIIILKQKINGEQIQILPEIFETMAQGEFIIQPDIDSKFAEEFLKEDSELREQIRVDAVSFGGALKLLRESKGWSQTHLANRLSIYPNSIRLQFARQGGFENYRLKVS